MGKDLESLLRSREERAAIISELGCVPESIMVRNGTDRAIDLQAAARSYQGVAWKRSERALTASFGPAAREMHRHFNASGASAGGGALSRFPQNIGRTLLRLYTRRGETVVDPFAGHNSRAELCWRSGRHYYGLDVSRAFCASNARLRTVLLDIRASDLFPESYNAQVHFIRADSTRMPLRDAVGDFTITSPPYWDIEYYGDEPEQLGRNHTYEEFIALLGEVARENARVLREGSFCVWFVNDFRRSGRFYSYHEDTANLLRAAGLTHWDTIIVDNGPSIRHSFATQIVREKVVAKRHEYALVFRKEGP